MFKKAFTKAENVPPVYAIHLFGTSVPIGKRQMSAPEQPTGEILLLLLVF
jgi:hypothetical protein